MSNADNQQPGFSTAGSCIDYSFQMKNYKNYVRQALIRYDDVELAACALMGADQNTEEVQGNYNVCDTLGKL